MKRKKTMMLFLPIVAVILILAVNFMAQEECDEYSGSFSENFDTEDYKDIRNSSVANWPPGPISLNYLGANFQVTEPSGMGAKIYVCDAGDFDGDGYPDLVGLDIANNYRLILVRNHFEDANGDGVDDDGIIFMIDPNEVYDTGLRVGPASITVADYNDDGLLDFFFYKNRRDEFGYTEFVAAMYINVGTETDPDFYPYYSSPNLNFTQRFMDEGIYCNWAADHLCSVDIDGDGDIDVLAISQDKIFLIRNPGVENFDIDSFEIAELSYDQRTGFTGNRGGSSIDAADFDKDGDIDIIGGTVHDVAYLVYYENDGTGFFTRYEIPIPEPDVTGTVATCVADFDHNGFIDIFGANDRWIAGNYAHMWIMRNQGLIEGAGPGVLPVNFEFKCLNNCDPILPSPHDVDMSAYLDYDQDGDVDVVLADANHSGDYYLIINQLAPVYALTGEARSTSYTSDIDPVRYAISKARISNIREAVRGGSSDGLSVEIYLSNNGRDWEFYQRFEGDEIQNRSDLPWHTFNHFGTRLMWKALLSAEEDEMEEYEGASFDTPLIHELTMEYVFVDRREYSRTSVAVTTVEDENGQDKKLVIAGTFYFPGWEGHLRAYDVSGMVPEDTSYSELRTVSRPDLSSPSGRELVASGVDILWDAGELLDSRSSSTRTIYTAHYVDSDFMRIDFTEGNVGTLGPILQDVNNDNEGLIRFVRGEGRTWKLGDINHSNPLVVGPPGGLASQMGDGYSDFKSNWQDRRKVVYVGANDGMIHCFDALTGEETWAFIPYNLLPKLKNMWVVDQATGERYFARDVYVDGSPVAADVFIDADGNGSREWRTVLICGQGPGKGSTLGGGTNYYFALDITDPYNPQPLWELTGEKMGETWSVPAIGKVVKDGQDTWAAFMGSGYDNDPSQTVGNVFYAVDIESGEAFWSYEVSDVDTSSEFTNIPNTLPGSPTAADIDEDGYTDRVYFGDLDGRLWKLDVSEEFTIRGRRVSWDSEIETIYEDAKNYPILSRPACWIDPNSAAPVPRLYFGTGGDDRAPMTATYSFIALKDTENPEVEWFLGDPDELNLPATKDKGDLGIGEKVWADPKVANFICYFSTLTGNIESVDPCENLLGLGNLYARYIS
ncbi:MAG: PilC/PilY family type IV pilus protein, partial [Candidatus Aminicenantales bacterium]